MMNFQSTSLLIGARMSKRLLSSLTTPNDYFPNRFKDKIAIVTGGSKGIGFDIAKRFAQEGCNVMICSRNEDNVNEALCKFSDLNLDGKVIGIAGHVGKDEDRRNLISSTVKAFGGIDFLINNAAVNPVKLDKDITWKFGPSQWEKVFSVNVQAPFFLSTLVSEEMEKRGGGAIVNVTTFAATNHVNVIGPGYPVSKAAQNMLTRYLAGEFASKNIRVNSIAPGLVDTEFLRNTTPSITKAALKFLNAKRLGSGDDISGIAAFLCSNDAKYIQGEVIRAVGGVIGALVIDVNNMH